jgi:hypothetical protein
VPAVYCRLFEQRGPMPQIMPPMKWLCAVNGLTIVPSANALTIRLARIQRRDRIGWRSIRKMLSVSLDGVAAHSLQRVSEGRSPAFLADKRRAAYRQVRWGVAQPWFPRHARLRNLFLKLVTGGRYDRPVTGSVVASLRRRNSTGSMRSSTASSSIADSSANCTAFRAAHA